jgi:hypothetical protein
MSLRDWFAGQALAGFMSRSAKDSPVIADCERVAIAVYGIADAMLAKRTKP